MRLLEKRPGAFHKVPRKGNGAVSVFSPMGERLGAWRGRSGAVRRS